MARTGRKVQDNETGCGVMSFKCFVYYISVKQHS